MGILAVISKPSRRVVHIASEMGVSIQTALKLSAMSDSTFDHYRHGFKGLLSMLDGGNYSKEDADVITTLDFMRNAIIREKARRKRNANPTNTK